MAELALVADIGGTNTRVALCRGRSVDNRSVRRYANAGCSGIGEVLSRYLEETGTDDAGITGCCVAGAGPVSDGTVTLTNLDWRVDAEAIGSVLTTTRVAVLNDLQAQGHAIGNLAEAEITRLVEGRDAQDHATKLVVGIGTGFNAAPVFETDTGRLVPPAEAGHVSLPVLGETGHRLAARLTERFGFAAVEEALSGRGIGHVHEALTGQETRAAEVMAAAEKGDEAARRTVAVVVELLGAVVGDLALMFLPRGGIYLVGGVARNLAPWFGPMEFAAAMRAKGRFGPFIGQFGVHLVTDDYAALAGCASHLAETAAAER